MFTGIIEAIGKVAALSGTGLEISVPSEWSLALGESVAVDGICLTAVRASGGAAVFDVSRETLKRTALGALRRGSSVNLERAMRADGRFSGHFVTGHVDGTARLLEVNKAAGSFELRFEAPAGAVLVEKGSVALNGVSLTVFGVSPSSFTTAVIPHTWKNTGLSRLRPGSLVNIEYDILGKYAALGKGSGLTTDLLSRNGFLS